MTRGDLVRDKRDGEIGIVLENQGTGWVYLFLGDGLRLFKVEDFLEVIPFKNGAAIPACFIELVEAYQRTTQ